MKRLKRIKKSGQANYRPNFFQTKKLFLREFSGQRFPFLDNENHIYARSFPNKETYSVTLLYKETYTGTLPDKKKTLLENFSSQRYTYARIYPDNETYMPEYFRTK